MTNGSDLAAEEGLLGETFELLIDEVLPDYDVTVIEHLVIDAPPDAVYETVREMDFMQIHSPLVDAAMAARGLPTTIGRWLGRPAPPPPQTMRLADLLDPPVDADAETDALEGWVGLGEVQGREIVFGAIGKVWQPDIDWKPVAADEFAAFAEPDYAKIAAGFSLRRYGRHRTLLSYEARTAGTDDGSRDKFLRYWWLVRPFVRVVMRAAVTTARDLAQESHSAS